MKVRNFSGLTALGLVLLCKQAYSEVVPYAVEPPLSEVESIVASLDQFTQELPETFPAPSPEVTTATSASWPFSGALTVLCAAAFSAALWHWFFLHHAHRSGYRLRNVQSGYWVIQDETGATVFGGSLLDCQAWLESGGVRDLFPHVTHSFGFRQMASASRASTTYHFHRES
jgi:hypothetical protein